MYIPDNDTQNYFCILQKSLKLFDTQLNEPINQNLIKVPKVVKPTHKKTFGTGVINSPMSPPSLGTYYLIDGLIGSYWVALLLKIIFGK